MGNCNKKTTPRPSYLNKDDCFVCWEKIKRNDYVTCSQCNIIIHTFCEEQYIYKKGYSKCPHCTKLGTLKQKIPFSLSKNQNKNKIHNFSNFQNILTTQKHQMD